MIAYLGVVCAVILILVALYALILHGAVILHFSPTYLPPSVHESR
jgi:hypothetical protein